MTVTGSKKESDYAMSPEIQQEIKNMVINYHQCKLKSDRANNAGWKKRFLAQSITIRNKTYLEIKDWQIRWVKGILAKWNRWETPQNVLSFSWDTFHFCIEQYKNYEIPIPKHFYEYSRYFLLNYYAKQNHLLIPTEELVETLSIVPCSENITFIKLLQLQQMRETLPQEFRGVWDDALGSLHSSPQSCYTEKGMYGLPRQVYFNLKKAFKPLIVFTLEK